MQWCVMYDTVVCGTSYSGVCIIQWCVCDVSYSGVWRIIPWCVVYQAVCGVGHTVVCGV